MIRLTRFGDGGGMSSGPVDPFAPVSVSSGPSSDDKTDALQAFFQRAGVNFELPGASLAFDGEQLIVTQSRQNLDRMRTILRNYSEVKQVEIEAKFLEVAQNDLDELGFNWTFRDGPVPQFDENLFPVTDNNGNQVNNYERNAITAGRTLNDAFATNSSASTIWQILEEPQSLQDLIEKIKGVYQINNIDILEKNIIDFLNQGIEKKIIDVYESTNN